MWVVFILWLQDWTKFKRKSIKFIIWITHFSHRKRKSDTVFISLVLRLLSVCLSVYLSVSLPLSVCMSVSLAFSFSLSLTLFYSNVYIFLNQNTVYRRYFAWWNLKIADIISTYIYASWHNEYFFNLLSSLHWRYCFVFVSKGIPCRI